MHFIVDVGVNVVVASMVLTSPTMQTAERLRWFKLHGCCPVLMHPRRITGPSFHHPSDPDIRVENLKILYVHIKSAMLTVDEPGGYAPLYRTCGTTCVMAAVETFTRYTDFQMPFVKVLAWVSGARVDVYGAQSQPPVHAINRPSMQAEESNEISRRLSSICNNLDATRGNE